MISKSPSLTLKACIVLLCLASLLGNAGCCVIAPGTRTLSCLGSDGSVRQSVTVHCCLTHYPSDGPCFSVRSCGTFCNDLVHLESEFQRGCDIANGLVFLESLSPASSSVGSTSSLTLSGSNLESAGSLAIFSADTGLDASSLIQVSDFSASFSEVHATVSISSLAPAGFYWISAITDMGRTNALAFAVRRTATPGGTAETMRARRARELLSPSRKGPTLQLLPQTVPAGSIVLTPVADGTVQQFLISRNQPGSSATIRTIGPSTTAATVELQSASIDSADRSAVFNFLRYGVGTGGAISLNGLTRLEAYSRTLPVPPSGELELNGTGFGEAGIVEFDLGSLRTTLEQLRLNASAVRATLRLTPVRSMNLQDFMSTAPAVEIPATTQVAILDMTQKQKDLIVNPNDFPGFTSPRVSNLQDLISTIRNVRAERRATVRNDLIGLLAPLSFDVTDTLQGDLRTAASSTGFQVVSSLNGAGLIFADSAMQIPGLSEIIAPQLIIELTGFTPSSQARLVTSTTRIPYDSLGQGSTDMILITVNNIGASPGTIALDVTSGANVFGLINTDGIPLSAQGSTATIAGGERLTFGVTFKPGSEGNFQGELQVTDTTGGKRDVLNRIALTGSGLPADFTSEISTIAAPVKPQSLPDQAARIGDLNGDGLIDAVDVGQLSAVVAGRVSVPSAGTTPFGVADINRDGRIDSVDLRTLGDALVGNLNGLPYLRPASGAITENAPALQSMPVNITRGNVGSATRAGVAVRPRL